MHAARLMLFALLACGLLLASVVAPNAAQADPGRLVVQTDYELIGTSTLSGGGHVTWTLTGEEAREFRKKLIGLFDTYDPIPRGFRFGGRSTNANGDGILQPAEGLVYTDLLELELEGAAAGLIGTQVGYFRLSRADLFEEAGEGSFERSTTGIAGSDANTTGDVQIRFLFDGGSTVSDAFVALPTQAYANALENVFSFHDAQSPTLNPVAPYPLAWPFTLAPPWHRVLAFGEPALWAGNDTTGLYENNTQASIVAYADPVLGASLDLRFATTAWVEFDYTGRTASGDSLRLEVAGEPGFSDWTALSYANQTGLPSTQMGIWVRASMDLSAYVGERVRLRFNFTSDASGTDVGFYVRNVAVHAPSMYVGRIVHTDAHYLIGLLSFSDIRIGTGGVTAIRTPGGEILYYSSEWASGTPPPDEVRFSTFNIPESPQMLFAALIVGSYLISHFQESAYDDFREAHPGPYRPAVRRARWLHWLGRITILLLVLFYFIPTAFYAIGLRVFVSGPAFLLLVLAATLALGLGTRAYYRQLLEETPPPTIPEIERPAAVAGPPPPSEERIPLGRCTHCLREIPATDRAYRCDCGAVYHLSCATGLMKCSNCRKPIALEVVRKKVSVSMRCASCGEIQTVPEGVDPRTATCSACGGHLRRLDAGKAYLVVASNPAIAFGWLKDLTKGGKPSLVLTPATPERLRLEFGLRGTDIVQVSSTAAQAVDPKRLDSAGLRAILPLSRSEQGGVLLYDGVEQMVNESSMADFVRFLRKANDMMFVHGITVIARVTPGSLDDSEVQRLASEFDEQMDLSAQL